MKMKPLKAHKVKFVQQRTDVDCVVACMAMITGKTYEETAEQLEMISEGEGAPYSSLSYIPLLVHNNLFLQNMTGTPWSHLYNGVYLCGCTSLNFVNRMHVVVVLVEENGNITILDPQCGRDGKFFLTAEDYETERFNPMEWQLVFECPTFHGLDALELEQEQQNESL